MFIFKFAGQTLNKSHFWSKIGDTACPFKDGCEITGIAAIANAFKYSFVGIVGKLANSVPTVYLCHLYNDLCRLSQMMKSAALNPSKAVGLCIQHSNPYL